MYGMAMEALNPGAAPPSDLAAEGGDAPASLMGDDFPSHSHKALTFGGCAPHGAAPLLGFCDVQCCVRSPRVCLVWSP